MTSLILLILLLFVLNAYATETFTLLHVAFRATVRMAFILLVVVLILGLMAYSFI